MVRDAYSGDYCMNKAFWFGFVSCLTLGCLQPSIARAAVDSLKIGAAEVDITPPIGHRMAGYFDERLSTAIHDPLNAKALVVQQGRERIALVFCDLAGFSLHVSTNARAQASQKTGIPVSNIMMCATHSHTGPLFDDVRRQYFHQTALAKFGTDPQEKIYYPDFLVERLVKVVVAAQAKLEPALLEAGIARQAGLPLLDEERQGRLQPGHAEPEHRPPGRTG
jgi:neutral ceramidase